MKKVKPKKHRNAWLYPLVAGALLWQVPGVSYAAEADEYAFDQVVVTATKTPVKQSEANANISVITKEKIEQQHYTDLEQALRDVPGVTLINYGSAGNETANGLKINGSANVIVLIDGVRAGHAGLTFPASTYMNLENVERIEVLRGSASAMYGADAKGGVINIITRKPQSDKNAVSISGGNFSRETYSFVKEGVADDWSYRIVAKKNLLGDYQDGHGNTIPQSLNADTLGFKVVKNLKEGSDITFSYNSYKSNWMYLDSAYGNGVIKGNVNDYDWNVVFNYKFNDNASNVFSYKNSSYDYAALYANNDPYFSNYVRTQTFADQFTRKFGDRHTVVTGFDYTKDEVVSSGGVKLNNKAFFLQDEWNITHQWKLTSGLRYDDHSLAGSSTTPRVNLGYKVNDKTNYYISYSEFFVAPTPYQLFDLDHGNGNLKPEDGSTKEFGVNHRFNDTLTATVHTFHRTTDNVIRYNYGSLKFYNTDEDAKGWDVQLNKRFSDTISGFVGYTYTNMKENNGTSVNVGGYIPKHAINVGLDYTTEKFDIGLQGRAAIDRKGDASQADFFPCDSYWIWDIGLNYKVNKATKAFVKINNIFDKFYAEQSAVSSYTPGNWYAMPGRNVIAGVEYAF